MSKFSIPEHAGLLRPSVLIYVSGMSGSLLGSAWEAET